MNIMQLGEGKKYKSSIGDRTWNVDKNGYIEDLDTTEDITDLHDSYNIKRMVFTEVKEPVVITLESEELELLKKIWDEHSYGESKDIVDKIDVKLESKVD